MSIQCRTCAEKIFNPNAINIFEQDDNEILFNIETLTGIRLYEEKYMPKHICTCCHLELYHSIAFRERCIKTQHLLQNQKPKAKLGTPKTPQEDVSSQNRMPNQPRSAVISKNKILSSPDSNDSKPCTSQRLTLLARKQNVDSESEKCNENCEKISYDSISTKASSVTVKRQSPVDLVHMEANSLNASPHSSLSHSAHVEEFNSLNALADIPEFLEDSLGQLSQAPGESSRDEPSPAQNVTTSTKMKSEEEKKIRKKKPPANPMVFICDLCGQISQTRKNLQIHIMRHKGEKNFECSECGLKHYSKYLLELHVRVKHRGEMPFPCRYCGQRFYSGTTRTRHEKVRHIRIFSYECKICGKKYMTKSCLNKHEFLHTGLRPHRCELCNVAFPRKPGLRIHCRTKQHQKRASDALNNQLNGIKEITVSDDIIVLSESIIQELDIQTAIDEVI